MGQVSITLNGRTYRLRCGDGEEARLLELSAHLRDKIARLASDFGQVGDDRLMIMAALLITDELFEARAQLAEIQTADPSLYAPLDDDTPDQKGKAETAASQPPVASLPHVSGSPHVSGLPDVAVALPAAAKIAMPAMPGPPVPVASDTQGSSLKRAMQRPQGKPTLSERLAEARETTPSGERPSPTGRKAGKGSATPEDRGIAPRRP